MAISGANTKSGEANELAEAVLQAAKKKYDQIPRERRRKLILAIDANRLPGLTLDSVVYRVREEHGATLAAMRFRSIWLVGPSVSLTHRLDA